MRSSFFVYSIPLLLLSTGLALGGHYQRTKDGKTLVWNEDHKSDDLVSWSGKRDADGYATGYGTLTWYAPEDAVETGSNLPRKHERVLRSVSGTMVQGKFAEASPQTIAQETVEPPKPKKKGWFGIFRSRPKPTPAQIEATPKPRRKSSSAHVEATTPESSPTPINAEASPTPAATPSSSGTSDSLDSLMHAPSSLRLNSPTPSPSPDTSSPAVTPDVSVQPAEPTSPSPTP